MVGCGIGLGVDVGAGTEVGVVVACGAAGAALLPIGVAVMDAFGVLQAASSASNATRERPIAPARNRKARLSILSV